MDQINPSYRVSFTAGLLQLQLKINDYLDRELVRCNCIESNTYNNYPWAKYLGRLVVAHDFLLHCIPLPLAHLLRLISHACSTFKINAGSSGDKISKVKARAECHTRSDRIICTNRAHFSLDYRKNGDYSAFVIKQNHQMGKLDSKVIQVQLEHLF